MAINNASGIKSIQRLLVSFASANATASGTISAVNMSKTTVDILGSSGVSTQNNAQFLIAELINSTTVRASRASTGAVADITVQVTEYF